MHEAAITGNQFYDLVKDIWPQLVVIFGIIWWGRKVDLKILDHRERLDRHDHRISSVETSQQLQAIQLARIEESLEAIKLTLDRIYSRIDHP